jgi:hypothetical protein
LQKRRVEERQDFINRKLMPDPNARYRLDEAITMKGVCEDMCPELERHEREAKALIDPWEYVRVSARSANLLNPGSSLAAQTQLCDLVALITKRLARLTNELLETWQSQVICGRCRRASGQQNIYGGEYSFDSLG